VVKGIDNNNSYHCFFLPTLRGLNVPKNPEEFYDLENDPFELNNLIGEKKYSKEIENLRIQLDNWIDQINDPVNIPEKELVKMLTE
jgi:hypothetical protein